MFHCNSLPRKNNFQRNTPARRSAAGIGAEPLIEYFIPRSLSEFDLSMMGTSEQTTQIPAFLPLTVRPPRKMANHNSSKQKEKMVTFEDEMAARLGKSSDIPDVFM